MAQLKDLIVTGGARLLSKLYVSDSVTAPTFIGKLQGNADTATKATQDSAGQQINTTYIKGLSVSGKTITYTKGNGSTATITTQDTTYGTATTSANGLMSSSDKSKLDGIATGATKITVDSAMSSTSTNPVQNKVVQAALDGKANSSHTHNYAGSSSAGGVANSAAKLSTARTLSANDDYIMSMSFDGSANVSTNLRAYNSVITISNTNNYPFHRFAKIDTLTSNWADKVMTLLITQDYYGGNFGICRIVLRTNDQSNKAVSQVSVEWLVRYGFATDAIQIGLYTSGGSTYADAFLKTTATYAGTVIRNLGSSARGSIQRTWTFMNSSEVGNTTTSSKGSSVEAYNTIANAGTTLHNQAYTSIVSGKDVGTTNYSNSSGSATSATKATQDSGGQQINTTYLKALSNKNGVITYTKGNNTTGTINTQDNFITLTQAQYDALVSSGQINENCYYFVTDMLSFPTLIQYVTLTVSGWTASSDGTYYTQTVAATQITADDNPMIIKNLPFSTAKSEATKYMKAFGILCAGVAETASKSVTWKVYKKPATDISVGLIKVLN